jgi:hypothetical protein
MLHVQHHITKDDQNMIVVTIAFSVSGNHQIEVIAFVKTVLCSGKLRHWLLHHLNLVQTHSNCAKSADDLIECKVISSISSSVVKMIENRTY